jgi:hypothetical protein
MFPEPVKLATDDKKELLACNRTVLIANGSGFVRSREIVGVHGLHGHPLPVLRRRRMSSEGARQLDGLREAGSLRSASRGRTLLAAEVVLIALSGRSGAERRREEGSC